MPLDSTRVLIAALLACALSLAACKSTNDAEAGPATAGSDALWKTLQAAEYRTTWQRAPGYEDGPIETVRAHRTTAMVWVNDVGAAALGGEPLEAWPVGTIIVKDSYGDEEGRELELVAAMEKTADGWLWAEWDDAGETKYAGSPGICLECHESGSDYVKAFALPK